MNDYSDYLFLKYKGKDLYELKHKTCKEIGIKFGDELKLKFKEFSSREHDRINRINFNNIDNNKDNDINKNDKDNNDNKDKDNDNNDIKMKMHISYNHRQEYNFNDKPKINVIFESLLCVKESVAIEFYKPIYVLIEKY